MPSLSKDFRRLLERSIAGENGARQIAESGAEQSLRRLAVDRNEAHQALSGIEKDLRTQLRAHGRQLGDKRDQQRGTQAIEHLKQAVAYEHWHRLLFARFLAENDLLMHPQHGVSLSLGEVKEIALGLDRDWIEVAAEFAQRMLLREVFRSDDPILRVPLPPEKRLELEKKLSSLPREVFLSDDSLGWVYQFWQKDAKERVNSSEVRVGEDEISPVTQLFTEDYMVLFLLENTLGAWWTARHGSVLPGYEWTYLRLDATSSPIAGNYEGWPNETKAIKLLDPCMGSGHFLTFALPILVRMRQAEETLSTEDAIAAVLRDNLYGLELDPRCSQIAAFNLAITAWKIAGHHFDLPQLNLACVGLGINAKEEDWVKLGGADSRAREAMRALYNLFSDAPVLGSLIDPERLSSSLFISEFSRVRSLLDEALEAEQVSDDAYELAIAAQGLVSSVNILIDKFTLVATNVPYLGRGRQVERLKEHCEVHYGNAKADLATSMISRAIRACQAGGTVAVVTKDEPLYLSDFKLFRPDILKCSKWNCAVRLGPRAFETISGEVVKAALLILSDGPPGQDYEFPGIDATASKTPAEKAETIRLGSLLWTSQLGQLCNPDSIIVLGKALGTNFLSEFANAWQGIATSDLPRFERRFWELPVVGDDWQFQQSVPDGTSEYSGREHILYWQNGAGDITDVCQKGATFRGQTAWNKTGIVIGQMSSLPATIYTGEKFSNTVAVIVPYKPEDVPAIWAFCSSTEFARLLRRVNPKLNVDNGYISKVPFNREHWNSEASKLYPLGLRVPSSNRCTQWLFHGNPKQSDNPLQVSVARMLGYQWPRQTGSTFAHCGAVLSDGIEHFASSDGIVCLSSIAGEESASTRLRLLIQEAFGEEYNISQLLAETKSKTLESWLRDEFFKEHCQVFHEYPFIWHVWDGLKEGFHALVNYHKLDRKNLEKLIFSYLGDWLTRQRQDLQNGIEGADTRVAAVEHLQDELKKILLGEKPYDIFVRWKPLATQPIGWEPDLNDGIRMNIRPWIQEAKVYKSTKPGILRCSPNLKFKNDRGREPFRNPENFPWYSNSADRVNDVHLEVAAKRTARGQQ